MNRTSCVAALKRSLGQTLIAGAAWAMTFWAPAQAPATTGYWTNNTTGTLNWQDPNRWADGVVPNAAGDVA